MKRKNEKIKLFVLAGLILLVFIVIFLFFYSNKFSKKLVLTSNVQPAITRDKEEKDIVKYSEKKISNLTISYPENWTTLSSNGKNILESNDKKTLISFPFNPLELESLFLKEKNTILIDNQKYEINFFENEVRNGAYIPDFKFGNETGIGFITTNKTEEENSKILDILKNIKVEVKNK